MLRNGLLLLSASQRRGRNYVRSEEETTRDTSEDFKARGSIKTKHAVVFSGFVVGPWIVVITI
jgi:hypothetical protein